MPFGQICRRVQWGFPPCLHTYQECLNMKLRETEFFREFIAVTTGLLLAVGAFAFVSIPVSIAIAGSVAHLT